MIEDYELSLASPRARPNWLHRLLAPFRSRRPAAAPISEHLRRDLGLGEHPIGRHPDNALDSTRVGSRTPLSDQAQEAMMANADFPHVEIYTSPTCPDCGQLKAWLTLNSVPFTERGLTDPAVAEEAKARTGVRVAPISVIGTDVVYGTFASQRPKLAGLLSLPRGA